MSKRTRMTISILCAAVLLLAAGILAMVRTDIPVEELKGVYSDRHSRFIAIDGMEVHYKDEGRGMPLLLLHGTSASLHTWDGWARRLAGDFRVIRPDLPAFGLTGPRPDKDYSIEGYVSFVAHFLSRLGVRECSLAGNSLGGQIAWRFALAHPRKVKKLVLIDSAGYPMDRIPFIFKIARCPFLAPVMRHATPRFIFEWNLEEVYGDDGEITPALVDRYYRLGRREGNRQALIERIRSSALEKSPVDRIPYLRMPVLIMWGEADSWIPVRHARLFHRDIRGSRLVIYEAAGHVPMEEMPERTSDDAGKFLEE